MYVIIFIHYFIIQNLYIYNFIIYIYVCINEKYNASKYIINILNYFIPDANYCYLGLLFSVNI